MLCRHVPCSPRWCAPGAAQQDSIHHSSNGIRCSTGGKNWSAYLVDVVRCHKPFSTQLCALKASSTAQHSSAQHNTAGDWRDAAAKSAEARLAFKDSSAVTQAVFFHPGAHNTGTKLHAVNYLTMLDTSTHSSRHAASAR